MTLINSFYIKKLDPHNVLKLNYMTRRLINVKGFKYWDLKRS
jgi:hypothetical protein